MFGVLFLLAFGVGKSSHEKSGSYEIVIFGDSVMADCRDETSVAAQLGALMECNVYNGAFGGTCMSRLDVSRNLGYTKDCLSFESLAKSIAAEDFGVQQTVRIRETATEYFDSVIDDLETIDFHSVEVLLIAYGVNDYHGGARICNEEDPYDIYTFTGALRSSIELLRGTYPELRIVLVTPPYSWYPDQQLTCEEYVLGGNILEDYVNAQLQLAEEMGVEIIDIYHDFYPHDTWSDWELYTRDGLHPTEAGRKLLAQTFADYLKQ